MTNLHLEQSKLTWRSSVAAHETADAFEYCYLRLCTGDDVLMSREGDTIVLNRDSKRIFAVEGQRGQIDLPADDFVVILMDTATTLFPEIISVIDGGEGPLLDYVAANENNTQASGYPQKSTHKAVDNTINHLTDQRISNG